jgi:Heparinase II/III-like protein
VLSADERSLVARAIQDQVLDVYGQGISAAFVHSYWYQSMDNFNTAINSGVILAALAIADTEVTPNTTAFAIDAYSLALISLSRSTAHAFYADGGHPEGPTYNTFGLQHLLPALDALRTAAGSVPISIPAAGGRALLDIVGPANLYVNWADTSACSSPTAGCGLTSGYEYSYVFFWFARNLADPALGYVAVARAALVTSPVHGFPGHYEPISARMLMSWPTVIGTQADLDALPPSRLMNDTRLAFLRAGWPSPPVAGGSSGRGSTFAAVKGCDNTLQQIIKGTTHTHADCGSFVLDIGGARFVTDLGSGPYMNPDPPYFSLHKFEFIEASTFGHNTLTFGGQPQDECAAWSADGAPASSDDVSCIGEIVDFFANATSGDGFALLDLTSVYAGSSGGASVRRGVALRSVAGGGAAPGAGQVSDWLAVADEFAGAAYAGVRWAAHTFAQPSVSVFEGATLRAQLSAVGKDGGAPTLVDVVVDASACPSAFFVALPVLNVTTPGLSRLEVLSASADCASLRVVFGQAPVPDGAPASVAALGAWASAGPWLPPRA